MKKDVYAEIPILENEKFMLRGIQAETDAEALLKVYSDERAVPLFNSDNCNGDDFYYKTMERMQQAIAFWQFSYEHRYFVRWAIVDKHRNEAVGTIELFNRRAEDYFDNCGLLRLDLRSDYERVESIHSILKLIVPKTKEFFFCNRIATKAIPIAEQRIYVLEQLGFHLSKEVLGGQAGKSYASYYVKEV